MTTHGVTAVSDDHPDGANTTTVLRAGSPVAGVIGSMTDVDAMRFTLTVPRRATIKVVSDAYPADPNLIARAVVKTTTGITKVTAVPTTSLGVDFSIDLPAGTYVVFIDGVGEADPVRSGYSGYGSLGRYVAFIAVA